MENQHRSPIMAMSGSRVHPADEMSISAISYGGPGMSRMMYSEPEPEPSRLRSTTLEDAKWSDMRKKAGFRRYPKEKIETTPKDKIDELRFFVRENFHQKECIKFVPKLNQKVNKVRDLKCQCGEILRFHAAIKADTFDKQKPISDSFVVPNELKSIVNKEYSPPPKDIPQDIPWVPENDLQTCTTASFGKISFEVEQIGGQKPAKYVRISDDDSVKKVLDLMKYHWRIMDPKPPNLVISVVGGAKNFRLDGRMRDTFSTGLIKAAKTTSAWLITSGFNMGVMKSVGQAVHEGQTFLWDDDRMTHLLRCIGIAPWGYIRGRHVLESEDTQGSFNASYRSSNVILHGRPVPLNPDHTHFIFVDDGYRNRYGGVADFRAKFEKLVSKDKNSGGEGIPVVLVVVEGGIDAIQDAKRSLEEGTPVVVCAGTGRAADIFAYAYKHVTRKGDKRVLKKKYQKKLKGFITESYGSSWKTFEKQETESKKYLDIVVNSCINNEDLIYVFHMNKHEDLDLAILSVLLKAKRDRNQGNRLEQLLLALTWNRADIAQREIFREDVNWEKGSLDDVMTKALLEDKVDFIKLLLNQGVVMKEYLVVKKLEELYSNISKNTHLFKLLKRETGGKEKFTLKDIGKYLKALLDKFDDDKYTEKTPEDLVKRLQMYHRKKHQGSEIFLEDKPNSDSAAQFTCPYKHLLIWSVLMNRFQLAIFFWEMGQEPITSAIVATRLCGVMVNKLPKYDNELRKDFEQGHELFEELATKVLDECHSVDPDKSMMLVERKSPMWSKMTCLQIAASAKDQAFLSSVGCQYSINNTWKHGILSSWRRVLLGVFLPIVIVTKFMELSHMGERKISWFQKLFIFYTAPITKFTHYTIQYLIFLCIYSYMVLVDFMPTPSISEWVCFIWIVTFLIGEIHSFLAFPSPTIYGKIRDWYGFLNRLDLINLNLSIIAFIIRWDPRYVFIAKTIYCVSAVVFYLRIMRVYTANSSLGPKLFMILKMFKELLTFGLVLGVFLLAYGVASQGLMYYTRQKNSFDVVIDVFYYPYWQLYGEIFLDEIQTDDVCTQSNNITAMDLESFSNTCRTKNILVPILLAGYLLVGNVLLLNLLIAIFSHVFDTVEKKSLEIWKYQMYFLVSEYDVKSVVIPPFSVILHIYLLFKWIFRKTCCAKQKEGVQFQPHHLMYLQLFEKEMMANFLRRKKANEMNNIDTKFTTLQKRVDDLTKLIEDEVVGGDESEEEMPGLETQDTNLVPSEPETKSHWNSVNTEDVIQLGKREQELNELIGDVSKSDEPRSQKFEDVAMEEVKKKHKKKKKKKDKEKRKHRERDEENLRENSFADDKPFSEGSKGADLLPLNLSPDSPPQILVSPRSPQTITKRSSFSPTNYPATQLDDDSESDDDIPRDKLGRRLSSKIKSRSSFMWDESSDEDNSSSRKRLRKKQKRKDKMYESKIMDVEDRLEKMTRSNQQVLEEIKSYLGKEQHKQT